MASKFQSQLVSNSIQMLCHEPSSRDWPGPQVPRQRLAQATSSCSSSESKSPVDLVAQTRQLCAQEVERQLAFSIPTEDKGLTSVPQGNFQFHRTSLLGPRSPAFSLMPSHITHLSWDLISLGKPSRAPSVGQGRPLVSSPVVFVFIGSDGAEPAWAHIQNLPFSGSVTPGKSLNCLVPPILYLLHRSPTQRADELNVVCPTVLKTVPGPWSVLRTVWSPLDCEPWRTGACHTPKFTDGFQDPRSGTKGSRAPQVEV